MISIFFKKSGPGERSFFFEYGFERTKSYDRLAAGVFNLSFQDTVTRFFYQVCVFEQNMLPALHRKLESCISDSFL